MNTNPPQAATAFQRQSAPLLKTTVRHGVRRGLVLTLALLALAGCSNGVDKPLVTGSGAEAYKASVAEAAGGMSAQEKEAFNWAVSSLTIDDLNTTYPGQSARKVIRGEVQAVLSNAPAGIAQLETQAAAWTAAAAPIRRVVAEGTTFALDNDFHGLQPKIRTTVHNGSPHGYSTLRWRADLYLDGASEPVASSELFDLYKNDGGLRPDARRVREFTVGFVTGDEAWTTLEVQNAKQRVVKLVVLPESAEDFGEKKIVGKSPASLLAPYKEALQKAETYKTL